MMFKIAIRRAARPVHARRAWLAVPWMCAGLAGAHAGAADAPAQPGFEPFPPYRGWREEPLEDWRAANERVGEIGGWRTYLRESQPSGEGEHGHPAAPVRKDAP